MRILNLRRVVQWMVAIIFVVGLAAYPVTAQDDELTMTYVSPDGGLSFRYPEGWTFDSHIGNELIATPPTERSGVLSFKIMTAEALAEWGLPANTTAETFIKTLHDYDQANENLVMLGATTPTEFNHMLGFLYEAHYAHQEETRQGIDAVLTADDSTLIWIRFGGTAETFSKYQPVAFAMLQTLNYAAPSVDLSGLVPITPENVAQLIQVEAVARYDHRPELLTYSPDGRYLALKSVKLTSEEQLEQVSLLDATTLEVVQTLAAPEGRNVMDFAFNADGSRLVVLSALLIGSQPENPGWLIQIWDVEPNTTIQWDLVAEASEVTKVIFTPDGQHLVIGYDDAEVVILDAATGAEVQRFAIYENPLVGTIEHLQYSPDGTLLATCGVIPENPVALFDATTHALQQAITSEIMACRDLDFHPSGTSLVAAGRRSIVIWGTISQSILWETEKPESVLRVEFSPDGQLIAAISGGFLRVYDAQNGALLTELDIMAGQPYRFPPRVQGLAFNPNGDTVIVMASFDSDTLRIFGVRP